MLITVSIGNTNTLFGIWEGDILHSTFRLRSQMDRTLDEWIALIYPHLDRLHQRETDCAVILISVVPDLTHHIMEAVDSVVHSKSSIVVTAKTPLGMTLSYERPESLGSDRFINVFAAWELFLRPHPTATHALVVDCGTATTFSIVSRSGEFLGGSILPGIGISIEALLARTAQLPHFDIVDAPLIATNTIDALRSGIVNGFAAQINGMIDGYALAPGSGTELITIGTGGAFNVIEHKIARLDVYDEVLPLHGLHLAYTRLNRH